MVVLNVHWETFDDESFDRLKKLAEKGPIVISPSPLHISKMTNAQILEVKRILTRPGYILGQQGLNHKCEKCKEFHLQKENGVVVKNGVDPWHENYCLWNGQVSRGEQKVLMEQGREKFFEIFGVKPEVYNPPNHYLDEVTLQVAAEIGYKYVTNRALIPLKPYSSQGIIVVPESEPEIKLNGQFYIHADRWRGDLDEVIGRHINSFESMEVGENKSSELEKNRRLKVGGKIFRDLHKGFGIKEGTAKEIAFLLYDTKFINDSFI